MNPTEEELSPVEQELGQKIEEATRYGLPDHLTARLERERLAFKPAIKTTKGPKWRSWTTLAAAILLALGLSLGLNLWLNQPTTVSADEISRRIDETNRKNLTAGTIVHRVYTIASQYGGQSSTGQHEEWAQVQADGFLSHYKIVQNQAFNGQNYQTVSLYIKDQQINQFWNASDNTIHKIASSNYQPKLNPLEDSTALVGFSQSSAQGTSQIVENRVSESDNRLYLVSFYYKNTSPDGQVNYSRVEFYVNKQNYEVEKVALVGMQRQNGPDTADKYTASLVSAELLPPDQARTKAIFVLGAPPDARES